MNYRFYSLFTISTDPGNVRKSVRDVKSRDTAAGRVKDDIR
jgi:hypothetical protein